MTLPSHDKKLVSNKIRARFLPLAVIVVAGFAASSHPVLALSPGPIIALEKQTQTHNSDILEVRAVVHRGGAAVGPRGNAAVYRSRTVVRGPAVRSGYHGAAIGFVTAATAAAWAGAAPAPGMCWYYTDPSRTQGFWDYCQ